jgi:hypothetical protein
MSFPSHPICQMAAVRSAVVRLFSLTSCCRNALSFARTKPWSKTSCVYILRLMPVMAFFFHPDGTAVALKLDFGRAHREFCNRAEPCKACIRHGRKCTYEKGASPLYEEAVSEALDLS